MSRPLNLAEYVAAARWLCDQLRQHRQQAGPLLASWAPYLPEFGRFLHHVTVQLGASDVSLSSAVPTLRQLMQPWFQTIVDTNPARRSPWLAIEPQPKVWTILTQMLSCGVVPWYPCTVVTSRVVLHPAGR